MIFYLYSLYVVEYNKQLQIEMDKEFAKSYQAEGKHSLLKNNYETTIVFPH